jgi:hypothetical protein
LALFEVSALATWYLSLELSTYLPNRDDDSIVFGYQYHTSFIATISQTPQEQVLWNQTTDKELLSSIGRWWCHQSKTLHLLIFDHIGKAGGEA